MDEKAARKMAIHCLEPFFRELEIHTSQQIADRIVTQLIIAYRMGVVKDREKEMAREMKLQVLRNGG